MKNDQPSFTALARKATLTGLIGACALFSIQAAPLPSAFGVWDRGEAQDPREHPYLRGTACDAPWDEVEKKPGVFDWSAMDQAVERAYKEKISLYFSFEAGPKTPEWVYAQGVPKVVTDNERHADKFPHYPYYLSPEYKTYYHRFLTAVAKHIFSLIEVHRGEPELPALRPPTEVRAFPGYGKGAKYQKGEPADTGEKARKGKRSKTGTGAAQKEDR